MNKEILDLTKLKKRDGSTPFSIPCEMDYFCPICHKNKTDVWDESLNFSEYEGFMWCPRCKIDIPSFFCLKADTKEKVRIYTKRFFEFFEKENER